MNKHLKTLTDTYTEDLVKNRGVSAGVYIIIAAQHKIIIKEFKESNDELEYEIELGNIKKLTLLLIGISFVIASYFFGHAIGEILEEILMVFGWVALWEVAYAIFFTDASRRRKIKRNNQIIKANIKYIDK